MSSEGLRTYHVLDAARRLGGCRVTYGSDEKLFARNPRLDFAEACLDL